MLNKIKEHIKKHPTIYIIIISFIIISIILIGAGIFAASRAAYLADSTSVSWQLGITATGVTVAALLAASGAICTAIISTYNTNRQLDQQFKISESQIQQQQEQLDQQFKISESQIQQQQEQLDQQFKISESQIQQQRRNEKEKSERELIKDLNDRLHKIISNRFDINSSIRMSSYFELACLYKDWGILSNNHEMIEQRRENQQKYIIKIIFAENKFLDYEKNKYEELDDFRRTSAETNSLNSILNDILNSSYSLESEFQYPGTKDFSYLYLSNLNFSGKDISGYDFRSSDLHEARLSWAKLENANFSLSNLSSAYMWDVNAKKANFFACNMNFTNLGHANLQKANLTGVKLNESNLFGIKNLDQITVDSKYPSKIELNKAHIDKSNKEILLSMENDILNFETIITDEKSIA
ncbi:pentapeptide repeat-containing protein [Rothia amarae]|uniref:pentapeptide repeat-containing protein n=1 Tax=Rothia amarae TaxID=169480 RepID=UPI0031D4317C